MSSERIAYTVSQAAAAIGLSKFALYDAIKQKELKAFQPHDGANFMILAEDLRAWITRQPAKANPKRHAHIKPRATATAAA